MNPDNLCLENPSVSYNNSFTNCPISHNNMRCGLPLYPGVVENGQGWLVGFYRIDGLLAVGGQARVYRGVRRDPENALKVGLIPVAVKALTLDNCVNDSAELQRQIDLFNAEADLLTNYIHNGSPYEGIVQVYGYKSFHDGRAFTVMELVEGQTLENLAKQKKMTVQEVVIYAAQLCDILTYVHSRHDSSGRPLVYRDLSPDNVMLQPNGKVKLLDFGIAQFSTGKTRATARGKESYAPLEQWAGNAESRSDQYSLAATIHALITGQPAVVPFNFTPIKQVRPDAPDHLEQALIKALSMNPEQRYDNMQEFKAAITNTARIVISGNTTKNPQPLNPPSVTIANLWTPTKQGVEYSVVRDSNYEKTQKKFRQECLRDPNNVQPTMILPGGIVVPKQFTFLETIIARLDDFFTYTNPDGSQRTEDERKALFNTWLDSSTAIAYQKKTNNAIIIPNSSELLTLPKDFSDAYWTVDFSKLSGINIKTTDSVQNKWRAALEGRNDVYNKYIQLMNHFGINHPNFWTINPPEQDQLRALCINSLDSNSNADGIDNLNDGTAFVRVARAKNFP